MKMLEIIKALVIFDWKCLHIHMTMKLCLVDGMEHV